MAAYAQDRHKVAGSMAGVTHKATYPPIDLADTLLIDRKNLTDRVQVDDTVFIFQA